MTLRLLAIGLGGGLGAIARYLLSGWAARATAPSAFPYGTLMVNTIGSFLLGLLIGLNVSGRLPLPEPTRAMLAIGFLGAFTTFSTFSLQTLDALRAGQAQIALANVVSSVVLAVGACWLGLAAAELLP